MLNGGTQASLKANERRANALIALAAMRERNIQAIPFLIEQAGQDKALLKLRLHQIDNAYFGSGRDLSLKHVVQAFQWCDTPLTKSPALVTLSWVLHGATNGARLSAWLLAIGLDQGFQLDFPTPYHRTPVGRPASQVVLSPAIQEGRLSVRGQ